MMLDISVVVPTRNRAQSLRKLLITLEKQTLSQNNYEILVIDNGSIDETGQLCAEYKTKFCNFQYLYNENPGLHIGRNMGYLQSKSEIIVFADDDIEVEPTWLEAISEGFKRHKDVVLIGGSDIPKYEEQPPQWVDELWRVQDNDIKLLVDYSCIILGNREKEINPYYVFGCNFAVRKWILDKAEGFHPDGVPDDLLCFRGDGESYISNYILSNGLKTLFIPEASVYHAVTKNRMTIEYVKKIAYRNGISSAYTLLRKNKIVSLVYVICREKIRCFVRMTKSSMMDELKDKERLRGMQYLLIQFIKNPNVREWIARKNYLEERGNIPLNKDN